MHRLVVISGTVGDKADHRPLPHATVTIAEQTVVTDVIGRFSIEVRAAQRHQLHVTHARALKDLSKKLTVLDKNLRLAVHLEVEPKPASPEREPRTSLVNFGEGIQPATEVFEYEKPDETKLAEEAAAAGHEFIPTWTTMEEEAENIASAEEDACAELDMDTVYEGLHATLTGCLSPGQQEEAILDGRNCLATLRAEGRFEESEGLHEILFEIESARGVPDSCVDKETIEVNQALEEISDRLEQAIIGTIPPSEVEEAQQDAVDLLSRLRQSHHQHEADLLQKMLSAMEQEMAAEHLLRQEMGLPSTEPQPSHEESGEQDHALDQQQQLEAEENQHREQQRLEAEEEQRREQEQRQQEAEQEQRQQEAEQQQRQQQAEAERQRLEAEQQQAAEQQQQREREQQRAQLSPPKPTAVAGAAGVTRAEVEQLLAAMQSEHQAQLSMMQQKQHAAAAAMEEQLYAAMSSRFEQQQEFAHRIEQLETNFGSVISEGLPARVAAIEQQLDGMQQGSQTAQSSRELIQSTQNDQLKKVAVLEQQLPLFTHLELRVGKVEEALLRHSGTNARVSAMGEQPSKPQPQEEPAPLTPPRISANPLAIVNPLAAPTSLAQPSSSILERTAQNFDQIDTNGDGLIDRAEWSSWTANKQGAASPSPTEPSSSALERPAPVATSNSLEQRVEKQLGQWEESIERRLGRLGVQRTENPVTSPGMPRLPAQKYVPAASARERLASRAASNQQNASRQIAGKAALTPASSLVGSRVGSSPRVAGWCGEISAAIEQHCNELAKRVDDAILELQGADTVPQRRPTRSESPTSPLTVNDLSLHPNPSYVPGGFTSGGPATYGSPTRAFGASGAHQLSPFSAHVRTLLQS